MFICSGGLPLFHRRLTLLYVISVSDVRHFPALLAKNFQRRPPIFWHVFGTAPSDLQLCFVQLKTLSPSAIYSTFKYPVTLKSGLWVTQGHRKLYHSIRHPCLRFNVFIHWLCACYKFFLWLWIVFITKIANFFPPRVFNAPAEGVTLGIGYRRGGLKKLEWWGFQMVEKFSDGLAVFIQYRRVTSSQPATSP